MSEVFVNYRVREDSGYATLLHRELERRFGPGSAFLAAQSVRAGDDFVQEVFSRLRECSVLLALIGEHWSVSATGPDWVRREIAEALAARTRVIPVLVDDAELPREADLPGEIADLAHCQAVRLRHYSFEADLSALVDELAQTVPALRRRTTGTMAEGRPVRYGVRGKPLGSRTISVIPGTIRRVRDADVWVNSENTDLQMARHNDFSVSAIIRYWGALRDPSGRLVVDLVADELAATSPRPVAPGTAVVTGSGALRASNNVRRIIHVASVQGEPGAGFRQVRNIDQCVTNVLRRAEGEAATDPEVRTVLFPLLGTGTAVGADIEATARQMVAAALDHWSGSPESLLREIAFLGYTTTEYAVLNRTLAEFPVDRL
ncbi:TIR domain-containing protein [Amycolatopsis rifamycinica]|uniref:Uncharacterized protein n=1 Tax=Amycolatopsis rifamycinica TaxID=287986 RepID=A0A066UCC4_9PSEU|nr:TIR domain-containing protein [Amycolatopsis rifamycinica]KDN21774.1 hypothetical protein DV20_12650 [Amycolatopsis rifamycinica]